MTPTPQSPLPDRFNKPWKLTWWGNETYPYPCSICTDDDECWILRDGTMSDPAIGPLIVRAVNAHADLVAACEAALDVLSRGEQVPEVNQLRAALAKAKGE